MRTNRNEFTMICTRGTNSPYHSYNFEAHMQRAIPYLCQLVDAITEAGFIGVRIDRCAGEVVGFSTVREKLAGWVFEGLVKAVQAGGIVPPILSVLIQLDAANAAFEAGLKEYEAMNRGTA